VPLADNTSLPPRRNDIFSRELDGELVLFDPLTNVTHRLNQTAAFVYLCCDGQRTLHDVAAEYQEAFGVAPEVSQRDVRHVLMSLERLALINSQA